MDIRFLSASEIEANMDLVETLNPEIPPKVLHQRLVEQLKEDYQCVGLFEKSQCMGFAGFRIGTRFFCGKFIDIDTVVVRPPYRSQGLGKMLMDWLHEYGKKEGCDVAVLDTYVENEAAHRFYGKLAYAKKGYHHLKVLKEDSPIGCHT